MWKIVKNGEIVGSIQHPTDVVIDGNRISNILALSKDHRRYLGIYDFIPGPIPDQYHKFEKAPELVIDDNLGEVREIVSFVPKDVDVVRTIKKTELKTYRNNLMFGGYLWNGNKIQTDEISLSRIQGMSVTFLAVTDPDLTIPWRTADDNTIQLTRDDGLQLGIEISSFVSACYAEQARQEAILDTLTDAQAIINHDISSGNWPVSGV